jgi:hypothetical protein
MSIDEFIARCDRYQEAAGVTRVWLSKRLFNDTYRLGQLANGETDVGIKRLDRALKDLEALEHERAERGSGEHRPAA